MTLDTRRSFQTVLRGKIIEQGFDLIFTGLQSQDRASAQVGVTLAEQLGFACVTTVVGFAYEWKKGALDWE